MAKPPLIVLPLNRESLNSRISRSQGQLVYCRRLFFFSSFLATSWVGPSSDSARGRSEGSPRKQSKGGAGVGVGVVVEAKETSASRGSLYILGPSLSTPLEGLGESVRRREGWPSRNFMVSGSVSTLAKQPSSPKGAALRLGHRVDEFPVRALCRRVRAHRPARRPSLLPSPLPLPPSPLPAVEEVPGRPTRG